MFQERFLRMGHLEAEDIFLAHPSLSIADFIRFFIKTSPLNIFLIRIISDELDLCNDCLFWLGLDNLAGRQTWTWLDGKVARKEDIYWTDYAPGYTGYHCAYMMLVENEVKAYKTDNYYHCDEKALALCEKEWGKLIQTQQIKCMCRGG